VGPGVHGVFRVPPRPRCHILYLRRGTIIWSLASPRPRVYITLLSRSRESDKPRHFLSACVYVRACTQTRGRRGIAEMRIRITALTGKVGEAADELLLWPRVLRARRAEIGFHIDAGHVTLSSGIVCVYRVYGQGGSLFRAYRSGLMRLKNSTRNADRMEEQPTH